jgi:hypothetical protein
VQRTFLKDANTSCTTDKPAKKSIKDPARGSWTYTELHVIIRIKMNEGKKQMIKKNGHPRFLEDCGAKHSMRFS